MTPHLLPMGKLRHVAWPRWRGKTLCKGRLALKFDGNDSRNLRPSVHFAKASCPFSILPFDPHNNSLSFTGKKPGGKKKKQRKPERGRPFPGVTEGVSKYLSRDLNLLLVSGERSSQASRAPTNWLTLAAQPGLPGPTGARRACAEGWEGWRGRGLGPGRWDSWGGEGKVHLKMPEPKEKNKYRM